MDQAACFMCTTDGALKMSIMVNSTANKILKKSKSLNCLHQFEFHNTGDNDL